jgi:hypothetical protein
VLLSCSGVLLPFLAERLGGYRGRAEALAGVAILLALSVGASQPRIARRIRVPRLLRFAGVFLVANVAVLHGWWKFLSGRRTVVWEPDRSHVA